MYWRYELDFFIDVDTPQKSIAFHLSLSTKNRQVIVWQNFGVTQEVYSLGFHLQWLLRQSSGGKSYFFLLKDFRTEETVSQDWVLQEEKLQIPSLPHIPAPAQTITLSSRTFVWNNDLALFMKELWESDPLICVRVYVKRLPLESRTNWNFFFCAQETTNFYKILPKYLLQTLSCSKVLFDGYFVPKGSVTEIWISHFPEVLFFFPRQDLGKNINPVIWFSFIWTDEVF